jgi:hypothetical protein
LIPLLFPIFQLARLLLFWMQNGRSIMSNMEKSTEERNSVEAQSAIEKTSGLYQEFLQLKPLYASKEEAFEGITRELESLAAKQGQTVEALLFEAHTSLNSQSHHTRALTFERMIARFRQ